MLLEPILGTILPIGRTKDYALRIAPLCLSEEARVLGMVGYQVINTSTGVVEREGAQLYQAINATAAMQEALDAAKNPVEKAATPASIFDN